jgi:hypothetical protein
MSGPKILTLDIETSPNLSWHFDTWHVDIAPIQIVEPSRMLCFAAKWEENKRIIFHHERETTHSDMVEHAVRLLDEADVVVTYNGDNFDLPWIEWERKLNGLTKPSPFVSVDLFKVIKREYKKAPARRSLDYITSQLGLTGKLQHKGYFPLWIDMNSDDEAVREKAHRTFRRYNKRDVLTTEELKFKLEESITNIPNVALYAPPTDPDPETRPPCPKGHDAAIRQGYKRTKTRRYRQYQCGVCGVWFSDTRSESGVGAA